MTEDSAITTQATTSYRPRNCNRADWLDYPVHATAQKVVDDKGRYHLLGWQTGMRDHLCAGRNVILHAVIIEISLIIIDRSTALRFMYESHA